MSHPKTAICAHGYDGDAAYSEHTGNLLGVTVRDESHADQYGSSFCPITD